MVTQSSQGARDLRTPQSASLLANAWLRQHRRASLSGRAAQIQRQLMTFFVQELVPYFTLLVVKDRARQLMKAHQLVSCLSPAAWLKAIRWSVPGPSRTTSALFETAPPPTRDLAAALSGQCLPEIPPQSSQCSRQHVCIVDPATSLTMSPHLCSNTCTVLSQ